MASAHFSRRPYDSTTRRRARQVRRLAMAAARPRLYPRAPVARAFWFDGILNFGDALTPWLLSRLGVITVHATPSTADLAGVGSILEMLPTEFSGAVWGSGSLHGRELDLPQAQIVALRGQLSREIIRGRGPIALGDPGILVSHLMKRPVRRWRLGIVPHHFHEDDPLWAQVAATDPQGVKMIDVRRKPSVVLREIGACEAIITTSLHGLITADAFGIPAAWTSRAPDLWGGAFKFRDYESAITPSRSRFVEVASAQDVMAIPRHTARVDASVVHALQDGLLRALHSADLPRSSPPGALLRVRPTGGSTTGRA